MRFFNTAVLSLALLAPVPAALVAQEHKTYHDAKNNDDHEWNDHEDQAYRIYVKQNHRKYKDFATINESDQARYWAWRHQHSDAVLKINIH